MSAGGIRSLAPLLRLGLLPGGVELGGAGLPRPSVQQGLETPEPALEPGVGAPERTLGVDAQVPADVYAGEQEVSELGLEALARFFGPPRAPQLLHLLLQLGEHPLHVGPVETDPGGAALQLLRCSERIRPIITIYMSPFGPTPK